MWASASRAVAALGARWRRGANAGHRGRTLLLGLLLAGGANPAAAAINFCVGTTAELDAALLTATSPTGQTIVIKLRQGTYAVGGSVLMSSRIYNAMQLLGGYNADCSERSVRASNTVLDGGGGFMQGSRMRGDLKVEGLRFQNMLGNEGAVMLYAYDDTDDFDISVYSNEFLGIGFYTGCYDCDGANPQIVNNLVSGAPADGVTARFGYSDKVFVYFANNTIVNSSARGILVQSDGVNTFANNVVWNNPQRDIWVEGDTDGNPGSARYYANIYDDRYGDEGAGSYGTLHADPQFVGVSNFRLQAGSPGVNTGKVVNPSASLDLDGRPRVIGSAPDRGAYEAQVDDTIPSTLTVTNTSDSGAGSLRQAILDANANPDFSFITFQIPGACPRTIAPLSALPTISQGVRIDGFSQPGSAANTRETGDNAVRCVILDGSNVIATGLAYTGSTSTQFWVQGLAIGGFTSAGLNLSGGLDNLVWGNQFGGRVGPVTLAGNGRGIVLTSFARSASIGGDSAVQRNVIAGSASAGIETGSLGFFSSTDNEIVGNLIGATGNGTLANGNGVGIRLATGGNRVRDNVIVNSASDGVLVNGGINNVIERNRIGRIDTVCVVFPVFSCLPDAAPNGRHGIRFENDAHDNTASANSVWNSGSMGISVGGSGRGNRLSANSIYQSASYGIDLDGTGLNDNDAAPAAQGQPNRGLNYPTITRAWGGNRTGWIEGTLASTNASYLIQVFTSATLDNVPNGEGEVFLRSGLASISNAPAGQNGSTAFRIAFSSPSVALSGRRFSLTAIDSAGNTSEYSFSAAYLCDVIFRQTFDSSEGDSCAP